MQLFIDQMVKNCKSFGNSLCLLLHTVNEFGSVSLLEMLTVANEEHLSRKKGTKKIFQTSIAG